MQRLFLWLVFTTMLATTASVQSQNAIHLDKDYADWEKTYREYHCSGDVDLLWVWSKDKCVLESGNFGGGSPRVERHRLYFRQRTYDMEEVSRDATKAVYSGSSLRVVVRLKEIGKCDYNVSNCTLFKYRAVVDIYQQGELVDTLVGFAASGS